MAFAADFVWGAGTCSFSNEGGWDADGRAPSIWDTFAQRPGAIFQGHTPAVASDMYHRWPEDVALMKELGLKGHRMSISWSRVLPEGVGRINQAGLAFYDRFIDAQLEAGIEPLVCLYVWDLPEALQQRGGWLVRDVADWFAEYAAVVVDRLSDRVSLWETLNEPQVFIPLGHLRGEHAPGLKCPLREVVNAAHHALLAHGRAVQVIRARARKRPRILLASTGPIRLPATDSQADIEAARRSTFEVANKSLWSAAWFLDPIFKGEYPPDALKAFAEDGPRIEPGDMQTIHQPLDLLGFNLYTADRVRADADGQPKILPQPPGVGRTMYDWPMTPEILYWGPRFLCERYPVPLIITENGYANADWVHLDGRVHDPDRIDFLHRYLRELKRACEQGIPVVGYYQWALMDNFECQHGYRLRMGLVHVDFQTLKRTPKDSAYWYREIISANGRLL